MPTEIVPVVRGDILRRKTFEFGFRSPSPAANAAGMSETADKSTQTRSRAKRIYLYLPSGGPVFGGFEGTTSGRASLTEGRKDLPSVAGIWPAPRFPCLRAWMFP